MHSRIGTPIPPGRFSQLGWRYLRVAGSGVAHLCPPTVLSGSRSACGIPLFDRTLETPEGLLTELRHCKDCEAADRPRRPQ
jgi:hypothetical protein